MSGTDQLAPGYIAWTTPSPKVRAAMRAMIKFYDSTFCRKCGTRFNTRHISGHVKQCWGAHSG